MDPVRLLPADYQGEARLVGAHPALADGLTVRAGGDAMGLRQPPLDLPFGSRITYDVLDAQGAVRGDDLTLFVAPVDDAFEVPGGTP